MQITVKDIHLLFDTSQLTLVDIVPGFTFSHL